LRSIDLTGLLWTAGGTEVRRILPRQLDDRIYGRAIAAKRGPSVSADDDLIEIALLD
jgi:hypothetical protein